MALNKCAGRNRWSVEGEQISGPGYQVIAAGDFNGDGREDFVLRAAQLSPTAWLVRRAPTRRAAVGKWSG
jgi:hypothetical protein